MSIQTSRRGFLKGAAGLSALGIAGMGNYFGAGIQSAVSGYLVGRDAATGKAELCQCRVGADGTPEVLWVQGER